MGTMICYILIFISEGLTAWLYVERVWPRKSSGLRVLLTFGVGYALLFGAAQLNQFALNILAFLAVNFFLAKSNYGCSGKSALLHTALLCTIMSLAEVVSAQAISLFGHAFNAYSQNVSVMVVMAVSSKLLYLAIALLCARFFGFSQTAREPGRLMVLFSTVPLLSGVICVFVAKAGSEADGDPIVDFMITVNTFILLAANYIILVLYKHLQKSHEENLTLQLAIQREESDAAYYQALQERSERQRILVHDIKNHLCVINRLAEEADADGIVAYLGKFMDTLEPGEHGRMCGNPILNILLLRYRQECHRRNVSFFCDVQDGGLRSMEQPSITTLFSNLLSNALEAAEYSEAKVVELSVREAPDQGITIISVVNSCDRPPERDSSGGFFTRKRTNGIHGVGLKSIARVVDRHGGISTAYYSPEDKQFHHVVQFPSETP